MLQNLSIMLNHTGGIMSLPQAWPRDTRGRCLHTIYFDHLSSNDFVLRLNCQQCQTLHYFDSSFEYKSLLTLTFIVASSIEETTTLKTGWNTTRVIGPRWPTMLYFSGGRSIHSEGLLLSRACPPVCISFKKAE